MGAEARSPGLPAQAAARSLAARLTDAGLHTTFLLVTALDLVMPEVTLVLLGCEGVMANGCVLATVGTSQTALMAKPGYLGAGGTRPASPCSTLSMTSPLPHLLTLSSLKLARFPLPACL